MTDFMSNVNTKSVSATPALFRHDFTHTDDHIPNTYEITPVSVKPFTNGEINCRLPFVNTGTVRRTGLLAKYSR